jgi:NAD(P)-dependent dehydrogenase (short-subunit alcohol dehydrogenase family)
MRRDHECADEKKNLFIHPAPSLAPEKQMSSPSLKGKVALVAGATRGAGRGIAIELGAAGATVYVTGRSTREQRSEVNRPETIEETAELVRKAGGEAIAMQVDHLDPAQVRRCRR